MRFVIAALGSRGDIEPFFNLAQGLRAQGHEVDMAVPENHQEDAASHGLGFIRIRSDFKSILSSHEGQRFTKSRNILSLITNMKRLSSELIKTMQDDLYQAVRDADACVFSYLCGPVIDVAEKTGVPCFMGLVNPVLGTGSYPHFGFTLKDLGPVFNRMTYDTLTLFMWLAFGPHCNRFRKRLGLPRPRIFRRVEQSGIPVLAAYSAMVSPRPPDWPDNAHVTGYWMPRPDPDWQAPPELERFIEAGPPPVCVTFGSMADPGIKRIITMVRSALSKLNLRGVFIAGWSGLEDDMDNTGFINIESAPYGWLFPRMAAVIQHGGAGTLAATLHAGIPPVIIPFFADQPFWAHRVNGLGVSPKPIRKQDLTGAGLLESINTAVNDTAMRKRATDLGAMINCENGVETAIGTINSYLGI